MLPARNGARRDAVADALGSVRAEGLEPTAFGLGLLDAIAAGRLDEDLAVAQLVAAHGR
ncbi:MAG: Antitoxin VbhA [Pseudonocardia sp.]